jgi:hypothetical protein
MTAPAADGTSCSDGNACNGVETCQAGVCTRGAAPSCGSGDPCQVGTCDPIDGCKTAPAADGTACALPHAAAATCTAGRCSLACDAGFGSCDGNDGNGCEHDLSADVNNCGACGNTCNPTCQKLLFAEDWESGAGGWWTADAGPIVVSSETAPCAGHFQTEAVSFAGGRVFSRTVVPTRGGEAYCLTAWARGTPGAIPFVGIHLTDAAGNPGPNEHWLIGMDGYPTGYGDVVTPVTSDNNWRFYAKSFVMDPGDNFIVVKDENFGPGASDFDQIRLFEGPCPSAPATICAAPAPICDGPKACTAGVCAM